MTRFLLVVAAALVAVSVAGQDVSDWVDRGSRALGEPGLLVVVDSLETQLSTRGGARTVSLVMEAADVNPAGLAAGSWARLSGALGADGRETLHRLFGSRVVVAFPTWGFPMPSDWVVATRVTRGDASRVLKALEAVNRGVIGGATLFSIERGAYQLCVLKSDEGGRLLVLGPAAGNRLFGRAVRGLQSDAGSAWFASGWPVDRAGGVLVSVPRVDAPSLAYAQSTDDGWAGVALTRNLLPADVRTWSDEDASAMTDGASLGMVGSVNAASLSSSPLAPFLGVNHGAAESVLGDVSRRGVLRLVTSDDGASAEVTVALETEPGRAVEADAMMRLLIAVVTGRAAEAPDFAGRYPSAMRTAALGGGFSDQLGRLVLGDRPSVRWRSSDASGGEHGLLAVSLGSGAADSAAMAGSLGSSLEGLRSAVDGPLVSAGRLEPGPMAGIVERAAGLERPVLEWVKGIESLTWRTRRADEDRVKASFEIELRGAE